MDRPTAFGELLRAFREFAGLSQGQLAERSGLSAKAIGALERGERQRPYPRTVDLLAKALGLNAAQRQALLTALRAQARQSSTVQCWDAASAEGPPGPPASHGATAASDLHHHGLPGEPTSFVGREREVAEIERLLFAAPSGGRLFTLTGAGGCGKTRLAIRVATNLADHFPDGAWFVDLAPLTDPALVLATVASALRVGEVPGRPAAAVLVDWLRSRELLLLLDNCEHVIEACARLADDLLHHCPRIRILATSRERLGIPGETTWRVPSLTLPDPDDAARLDRLLRSEAARLFVERARAAHPLFTVSPADVPLLIEICHRLDGIPFALELAAARVRVLTLAQIAARTDDRFRLLTGGSRTALRRHQTLRALIDWSYDLLSEEERTLLRRLSVFSGVWTLQAAEAVCSDPPAPSASEAGTQRRGDAGTDPRFDAVWRKSGGGAQGAWQWGRQDRPPQDPRVPGSGAVRAEDVLDLLTGLVDKSLVIADQEGGGRYRFLETLRQYAAEKLSESGEVATMRTRHRDWFLARSDELAREVFGSASLAWVDRFDGEQDNLRAALEWSRHGTPGGARLGLRLAANLNYYWGWRREKNGVREGIDWLQAFLDLAPERDQQRGEAVSAAANLTRWAGESARSLAYAEEAAAILEEVGDAPGRCYALLQVGLTLAEEGKYDQARVWVQRSVDLARAGGRRGDLANGLRDLGIVSLVAGDFASARSSLEESLSLARATGNPPMLNRVLLHLGVLERYEGNLDRARARFAEAMNISPHAASFVGGAAQVSQVSLVWAEGDHDGARATLQSLLASRWRDGDSYNSATALCVLGAFAIAEG